MRLMPQSNAPVECDANNAGAMYFDTPSQQTLICDGNIWNEFKGEQGEQGEKGEQGDKGDRGPRGSNGTDGTNGRDGRDGWDGIDGTDGEDGEDGKDGSFDDAFDVSFFQFNSIDSATRTLGQFPFCAVSLAGSIHERQACRCAVEKRGSTWSMRIILDDSVDGLCACGAVCIKSK